MRQARSAGQLPIRAQSGNSARPITGQQQQMMNSQRIMQGTLPTVASWRVGRGGVEGQLSTLNFRLSENLFVQKF